MWEPSNETEHRLREALRADDQDGYFRILSQIELVLPLSYEDPTSVGADTWATWTTDDRTHILAFTSETALAVCLRDNAGSSRRVRFNALADAWPDQEWWLAVNPGLPIEGYLPAWFVSQVAQGMTTVPADSPPEPGHGPAPTDQAFSPVNQSDPFANPMEPVQPRRDNSFMPAAPSVPDVPPAPRRNSENDQAGQYSTVAGETPAGLPLRQPPTAEPPAAPPPPSQADPFAAPAPDRGETFSEQPQWPDDQNEWPDAPAWLREQQPDPSTLPERNPGAGYQSQPDPFAAQSPPPPEPNRQPDLFAHSDPFAQPSRPPQSEAAAPDSFATMGSAFGNRGAQADPPPTPPAEQHHHREQGPTPVELTGAEAEPRLAEAASGGDTAGFLQTLLTTSVVLPVADAAATAIRVGDPAFRWASDIVDGIHGITVYTTPERLAERAGEDTPYTTVPFGWLIQHWPGVEYSLYVNPGTEVGANMSGPEVEPLLKWAEAKGLLDFATEMEQRQAAEARAAEAESASGPIMWQKTIPHHQVSFYLERGYDRVGGFVHPSDEVDHLRTPAQLYLALGLLRTSEAFSPTDDSVHVLRWIGYRTDLYPAALGGNDSAGAAERGGWVVEAAPFRGDGLAPSESGEERISEHKVDSVRLPHGARILRIDSRGEVTEIAEFDCDTREWVPVEGAFGAPAAIEAGPSSVPSQPRAQMSEPDLGSGPMGEAAPGRYEGSALGEAFGGDPSDGHYDLVRPAPDEQAASVLENREWKGA
ncbi:SseB family protein [Glycomyces salinus]|uniref:SseB family protein n=1 Tax=Glycomyces salinus TaxID=980294 RepID=UPI0018EC2E6B|nr:SseB family protein [Glycomyces salinus]